MTKKDRNYILISLIFMAISGVGIEVLDQFFKIKTEFGIRTNPWMDEIKLIHNLFNFTFIFCVGKIFNSHIALGLKNIKKQRRFTGLISIFCIGCLVLSGTFLLYVGSDELLEIAAFIHWYLGLTLILSFLVHLNWPLLLSFFKTSKT